MSISLYKLIRPILFRFDPEEIHNKVFRIGKLFSGPVGCRLFEYLYGYDNEILHTKVLGLNFSSPVGLAAGFDKNGDLVDFLPSLGFGFLEIGSLSANPSKGNPKPRIFRLPADQAIINRMGLNNRGADEVCERLSRKRFKVPLGINIVKTHDPAIQGKKGIEDFCNSYKKLYHIADYITLNISCPNTAEGKTFEDKKALHQLLSAVRAVGKRFKRKTPLLIKMSPDIDYKRVDSLTEVCNRHKIDGYVVANTTSSRSHLKTSSARLSEIGNGGVSGSPLKKRSTDLISHIYNRHKEAVIIGAGGIFSADDAYEKIKAGASLVQIYTGMVYKGPALLKEINSGLVRLLKRDGFSNIGEAVGQSD